MSTTPPLSSPRGISPPLALLAPSSAQVISNLARERLKTLAEPSTIALAPPLSADPLEIYYEKLQKAIESFKEDQVVEARKIFREAINELPRTDDLKHKYAHAAGYINLAATFELGNPARNETALKAQPFIFAIYDEIVRATSKEEAHPTRVLLNELSQLLTDKASFTYLTLKGKIETLNARYGEALDDSPLIEGVSLKEVPSTPPKVTKDPVEGSWKTARVFFAFGVASFVIAVSVFALYRSVTKID